MVWTTAAIGITCERGGLLSAIVRKTCMRRARRLEMNLTTSGMGDSFTQAQWRTVIAEHERLRSDALPALQNTRATCESLFSLTASRSMAL